MITPNTSSEYDAKEELHLTNLQAIWNCRSITALTVNSKGAFIPLTLIQQIRIFFCGRTASEKTAMTNALKSFYNNHGMYLISHTHDGTFNTTQKIVLRTLKEHHDPEFIKFFKEKMDDADLENGQQSNKAFAKAVYHNHKTRLDRKIQEARLAILCGIEPKNAGEGTTGTMFLRGLNRQKIGVYKRATDELPLLTRLPLLIKSFTWGQLSFLKGGSDVQCKAEVAAVVVSKFFEFNLTPECKFLSGESSLDGYSRGTFMEYLTEHSDAKKEAEKFNKMVPNQNELNLLQSFFVFDFLIGNLDRHMENWFVKFENNQEINGQRAILKTIKAIDNGNAFPVKNQKKKPLPNQLQWAQLSVASLKFTETTKKFIIDNMKPELIENCLKKINTKLPGFMNEAMETTMHQRAAALKKLASTEEASPKDLRDHYVTDQALKAGLKRKT